MATMQIWAYRGVPTTVALEGYDVEAADGSIGTIEEATRQSGENYIVVDTGPWIFGKRVLLPAGIVDRVDSDERKVYVNRSREEIRNAPEYNPDLGVTEMSRRNIGSYYASGQVGATRSASRPTTTRQPTRSRSKPQATRSRSTRQRSSSTSRTRSQSRTRASTRGRTSDEPTKDELYEQAKRLGIEGRSKMNKTQLKRAVSRRGSSSGQSGRRTSASGRRTTATSRRKANPVEVQAFLEGVSYPTRKGDLVREAERKRASQKVRSTLERLPERRFGDPTEVSEAIGKLR